VTSRGVRGGVTDTQSVISRGMRGGEERQRDLSHSCVVLSLSAIKFQFACFFLKSHYHLFYFLFSGIEFLFAEIWQNCILF
jgi:hypothetical protein